MGTTLDIKPFRPTNNANILNAIRKNASLDYRSRIPQATQANVQDVVRNLSEYRPQMNEFIDALVNRIGMEIYKTKTWSNPLAKFKRGMLTFGTTIEEVQTGLIQSKRYNSDRESLEQDIFGQYIPDVQSAFHTVNRQDFYPLTINEALLHRAFLDEMGLSGFIAQLMTTQETSDNVDEFNLMTGLFKEYDRADGFFRVHVPDVASTASDEADAKAFLREARGIASTLPFMSTYYNASGMPTAATADELELFISPRANAAIDVEALAGAFNVDKASMSGRVNIIPEEKFPTGVQALLTVADFFVVADSRLETTSAINPVGLHTNYFLHHWQTISASKFVPAVAFTTGAGDVITITDTPASSLTTPTIADKDGATVTTVTRGEYYQIIADTDLHSAVRFTLEGNSTLKSDLSQSGVLKVALDEANGTLKVTVTAVDSGDSDNPQLTKVLNISVVGDYVQDWPNPQVIPDADKDGLLEVTPEAVPAAPTSGASKNKVTIPQTQGVDYKDGATTVSGTTITLTANKTITAVAQAGYELATGATASWTLVFTA